MAETFYVNEDERYGCCEHFSFDLVQGTATVSPIGSGHNAPRKENMAERNERCHGDASAFFCSLTFC